MLVPLFISLLLNLSLSFGHGGAHHDNEDVHTNDYEAIGYAGHQDFSTEIYKDVNKDYIKNIKPIFKRACFDCHSNQTNYPWYYKIPGIKQFIDSDIKEAKSHLDFSNDFPFISHEKPLEDLKEIAEDIEEGEMPPKKYLWLHSDAKLSKAEIKEVQRWVQDSIKKIK